MELKVNKTEWSIAWATSPVSTNQNSRKNVHTNVWQTDRQRNYLCSEVALPKKLDHDKTLVFVLERWDGQENNLSSNKKYQINRYYYIRWTQMGLKYYKSCKEGQCQDGNFWNTTC